MRTRRRTPAVAALAAAAVATAAALGTAAPAAATPAAAAAQLPAPSIPPPIVAPQPTAPSAFDGNGMWIWYASKSSGGNPDAMAQRAQASGVGTVYLKSSDGTSYWSSQFSPAYVAALKARGLRVCAWQYVYGRAPVTEARLGRRAIQAGADCLVIDAESEYEGKYAQAALYMRRLRAYTGPDYPMGLAGFPYVDYHPAYPYSVFLGPGGAQFNVPQMYWKAIGVSVDEVYAHTYLYNSVYARPIAPLGQLYQAPRRSEILRFRQLASAYGAHGVSWWDWQETSTGAWAALARLLSPLAAAQEPLPVAPILRRRARGDLVVWAQQHLLAAGERVSVNGVYDTRTVRAVRAYQLATALPVTGVLDAITWQALLALPPAKVQWRFAAGRTTASAAGGDRRTGPASAWLPARAREIPQKRH